MAPQMRPPPVAKLSKPATQFVTKFCNVASIQNRAEKAGCWMPCLRGKPHDGGQRSDI